jgi:hypothetical protein
MVQLAAQAIAHKVYNPAVLKSESVYVKQLKQRFLQRLTNKKPSKLSRKILFRIKNYRLGVKSHAQLDYDPLSQLLSRDQTVS